jgi:hypothetical protein
MLRLVTLWVPDGLIQNDLAIPAPRSWAIHCSSTIVSNTLSNSEAFETLPFLQSISWHALYFLVGAPQLLLGHLLQYLRLYSSDSPSLSKNWYRAHVWFSCQGTLQVKQLAKLHLVHIIFGCESWAKGSARWGTNYFQSSRSNTPPGA